MKELINSLILFGLNEKEARLYLAALSAGIAPVTILARKADLKRPTTYLALENLLKKGFVITVPRGKKVHYKAESPRHILKIMSDHQAKIEAITPQLEMLYQKNTQQPKIRFYEGKNKLRTLYEEIFRSKEIWSLVSIESFLSIFTQKDEKHFFRILIRYGGSIHDIFEDTKSARMFARAPYRSAVGTVKFLRKDVKITNDILVFDHKVAVISFQGVTATVIEDTSVAATLKMMLTFMWMALPES